MYCLTQPEGSDIFGINLLVPGCWIKEIEDSFIGVILGPFAPYTVKYDTLTTIRGYLQTWDNVS